MVLLFSLTKPLGKNGGFPGEDFEALCQGEVGIHEEQFLVLQGGGLCFLRPGIGSKMAGIIWDFSAQIENFHIFFGETDDNHHWKIRTIPFFRPSSALPETGVLR